MTNFLEQLQQARVDWQTMKESPYSFQAVFQGTVVRLRLNDFPEELLCTVIFDCTETDPHEFSKLWTLPRHRGEQQ
jgi:hypothetical protein